MALEIMHLSTSLIQKQAVMEIEKCNEFSAQFGLTLSHSQAIELVETRAQALRGNGRIEFGGGVIQRIIREFCHSPYISSHNYEETLQELVETFYYYKNETLDLLSDDELIQFMRTRFNGVCQGSLELLAGRELYNLASNLRFGYAPNYWEDPAEDEEDEDEEDNADEQNHGGY